MIIVILPEAKEDLKLGYRFYEAQRSGVGAYFLESLYTDIDSLRHLPGIHPIHFGTYHRMLAKRFPFGIFYKVEGQEVRVYAVIDMRRNPKWIRKRLVGTGAG